MAQWGYGAVRRYIQQQFGPWGRVELDRFEWQGREHYNIVLHLPAISEKRAKPPILIGAHYDAVPGSPGADDNASGVAVLLELARSLSERPLQRSVRLVAFDLEEYGLQGSTHYAELCYQQKLPLAVAISLEMLGYRCTEPHSQRYPVSLLRYVYPDCGDFIGAIGNWSAIPAMLRLYGGMRTERVKYWWLVAGRRGVILPDTRRSDHAPFWDRGYPALMLTDTANLRNPHYHRASDRLETLDLDFLTSVYRGLIQGLRRL
ncbi:MAG: M28 family peptidase [Cyanobacteria bacterium J06642_2]